MRAQYIIFGDDEGEDAVMLAGPTAEADRNYFEKNIVPALRPMTDDEYGFGPAVMLHTFARFSYILFGNDVYWCAEWGPGLIVVRFSPDGTLAWGAFRSPVPTFGGRKATDEDLRHYDEDAENHQYNLVFRAWDSQFDHDTRKWCSFERADEETQQAYYAALRHVGELGEELRARYAHKSDWERWSNQCKESLDRWAGQGIRTRSA